jgi:hypothetical protein
MKFKSRSLFYLDVDCRKKFRSAYRTSMDKMELTGQIHKKQIYIYPIHPILISPALTNLLKNQVHIQHTRERNLAQQ